MLKSIFDSLTGDEFYMAEDSGEGDGGGGSGSGTTVDPFDGVDFQSYLSNHIPDDMKEMGHWKNMQTFGDLVKSQGNAQRLVGGSIRKPKEDASPEEWAKYYKNLGHPDEPAGYQITEIPMADKLDPDSLEWFKRASHEAGVPQESFTKLVDSYVRFATSKQNESEGARIEAARQAEEVLRDPTRWGSNYDRNLAMAKRALTKMGSEDVVNKIEASGLGNDPDFLEIFAQVGKRMAEHGAIDGDVKGVVGPEAARARIAELTKSEAYLTRSDPKHRETVDEVQKLYQIAYDI